MATWLDDILTAFGNLGGTARYRDLYDEIERIRTAPLAANWQATVRERIERHSSESTAGKHAEAPDLFYSVGGIRSGHWGLRGYSAHTPIPADASDPTVSGRVRTEVYRILRDTDLARTIKLLHDDACQICGHVIPFPGGGRYSEVHHLRPLGSPHDGPDIAGNIIVLCPNHHVMCDYGMIRLDLDMLTVHNEHSIVADCLNYHNTHILR
jgi:hypothetical protein